MRKKHGGGVRKYRRLSKKRDWSSNNTSYPDVKKTRRSSERRQDSKEGSGQSKGEFVQGSLWQGERREQTAETRTMRTTRRKSRLDRITRNEDIRKEAHVKPVETFLENKRLKWFGHCLRREPNHICAKSLGLDTALYKNYLKLP